jgi:hypothetical protein
MYSETKQIACHISVHNVKQHMCLVYNYPIIGFVRPLELQDFDAHRLLDIRHMKVAKFSALRTDPLYYPEDIAGSQFC